jgi:ring-1,2-phenylacetyl-CoA epoxidase subunit PaaE
VIQLTQSILEQKGINKKQIHKEYFSTAASTSNNVSSGISKIKIHLNGEVIEYTSDGKKPILDELIGMKKNPPYSCTSGACSSCMAKVISGKVEMEVCYALDDADLDKGLILTCQAKSITPELEITYEV